MLKIIATLLILGIVLLVFRIVSGTSIGVMARRHLGPLVCGVLGHRRDGHSVRKIGQGYQARCRRCDARLTKETRDAEWIAVRRPSSEADDGIGGIERRGAGRGHATTIEPGEERSA